uniref:Torsin n=1 Tax=Eptatretus burgeri TaxID=7764 RepID=A0A8C4WVU5_EPTBU
MRLSLWASLSHRRQVSVMDSSKIFPFLLLFHLLLLAPSSSIEPISTAAFIGVTTAVTSLVTYYTGTQSHFAMFCYLWECCVEDGNNVGLKEDQLEQDLKENVFGQHLVQKIVVKAIKNFVKNPNPKKALALSFHGWSGTGKNFVSNMIVKNLYKNGLSSIFVHYFVATKHFPHAEYVQKYKDDLQKWIQGNVSVCQRSLFVFDEMDKMHPGLIDAIKPFLDFHIMLDNVNYRKSIFIFLSNAGGVQINNVAMDFWKEGKDRESIAMVDVEPLLQMGAFNEKTSGFWHANVVDKHLVDFFVPFLPLEQRHVRMCINAEIKSRGLEFKNSEEKEKIIDAVLDEMTYFPHLERIYAGG